MSTPLVDIELARDHRRDVRLANERRAVARRQQDQVGQLHVVTPADLISDASSDLMRGHGTYVRGCSLFSSVCGSVHRVNRLVSVRSTRVPRFVAEIGDVVVARVVEVQQRRWKLEANARMHALLHLSSVNLPGGELRRRSDADALAMRSVLSEGDLVVCEVQTLYSDSSFGLHTRSLKYGKLTQPGMLIKVSPHLIERSKIHCHDALALSDGHALNVILANNGFVWIASNKESKGDGEEDESGKEHVIDQDERLAMARLRNVTVALADNNVMLWDTSLALAFEISMKHEDVTDLLRPAVKTEVAEETRKRLVLAANQSS